MSVFAMICRECGYEQEVKGTVGTVPEVCCETCGTALQRSFRGRADETPLLNLGYREERYGNETDRNIAKYQFTNL